jgi:uncharacterized SAM-binding protein YcdF (DUF218 family)
MREFLSSVINPLPILYLLVAAGMILLTFRHKKAGRISLAIAGIWLFIISSSFLPRILVRSLEGKYSQLSDSVIKTIQTPCDIIVLGAGCYDENGLSPNNQLTTIGLSRLAEGIRIRKFIPGSRLILSGFNIRSGISEALLLYRTALFLGTDSSAMAIQTEPYNTRMEAEEYVRNFGRNNNLIVVTSAVHMPRAMMLFRAAGTDPVAAPANRLLYNVSSRSLISWFPTSDNIEMLESYIHELAGIIWGRIGGK